MKAAYRTDIGLVRPDNQDEAAIKEFSDGSLLVAVADGLSGQPLGDRAAAIAKQHILNFSPAPSAIASQLAYLFHACDREIFQTSEKVLHDQEMGTTLTAAFIKSGTVYWAHAGDSRLYLWRGGILTQITADDTPAAFLVGEGKLTKDEARLHPARHGLFECLGRGVLELQSGEFAVRQGDLLLLTSDGLHGEISEDVIRSILKFDLDLDGRVGQLINKAKEAGGSDNITAIGIEI